MVKNICLIRKISSIFVETKQNKMRTFKKYKQNLRVVNYDGADYVMSYTTRVAKIDYGTGELIQLGYWSVTTQKHINYAAKELNLQLIKNK